MAYSASWQRIKEMPTCVPYSHNTECHCVTAVLTPALVPKQSRATSDESRFWKAISFMGAVWYRSIRCALCSHSSVGYQREGAQQRFRVRLGGGAAPTTTCYWRFMTKARIVHREQAGRRKDHVLSSWAHRFVFGPVLEQTPAPKTFCAGWRIILYLRPRLTVCWVCGSCNHHTEPGTLCRHSCCKPCCPANCDITPCCCRRECY